MKSILSISFLLSISLLFFSCDKNIDLRKSCQDIQFYTTFEMKVGESACLPDGRSILLLEARDEFCPCLALCIWEGQLIIKLQTKDLFESETEIEVGSTKNIPHGDIFEDVSISDFTYLYNDSDSSLPLCQGTFDEANITIVLTLSNQ